MFKHRVAASPSFRTSSAPHDGHFLGIFHRRVPFGRFDNTGPTTSGMTSPARRTTTVSLGRTSFRATSSSLCSVAVVMFTPPTNTVSSLANGVTTPVRPTEARMSLSGVVRSSGGNLYAIAHRGALEVNPSSSCCAIESTFTTTPSIS